MSVEITEFIEIDPDAVHAVFKAANGTPFLMLKAIGDDYAGHEAHEKDLIDQLEEMHDGDDDDEAEKAEFCGDSTCEICIGLAVKGKLSMAERRRIPKSDFAIPEKAPEHGSYPVKDRRHARAALSLVAQHGTPEEKARVRRKVAEKFPDIGKGKKERKVKKKSKKALASQQETEQAAHGDVPSPSGLMGQTNANDRKQATIKDVESDRPSGKAKRLDGGTILAEGEGFGHTAPEKEIPKEEAETQTSRRVAEQQGRQVASKQAEHEVDMKGDHIASSPHEGGEAEGRAQAQTEANTREHTSGAGEIRDQMTRQSEQAQKAFKFKVEKKGKKKRKKNAPHMLSGALKQTDPQRVISWPNATKEFDQMTGAELAETMVAVFDARDARKAEAKRAKKAKKSKKEKKAKKSARAAVATTEGSEEAAGSAVKSATPQMLVEGIGDAVSLAIKDALKPLADKIENIERQPARPRPALNPLAGKTPELRDQGRAAKSTPYSELAPLEEAFKSEANPYKKEKLGGELTKARLVIRERMAHGIPVSAEDAEALAAAGA